MRYVIVIVAGLGLVLSGCAREEPCCPCVEERVLNQSLMLLLANARSHHHQADLYLQQGEVDQAIGAVRRILALELDVKWPEAEEVRLDASARLAKLLLGQGNEAEALGQVDQSIAGAQRDSFYLANLHAVRGEILEHRSRRLTKELQTEQAKEVGREAIEAFERSISINKRLQKKLLKQQQLLKQQRLLKQKQVSNGRNP